MLEQGKIRKNKKTYNLLLQFIQSTEYNEWDLCIIKHFIAK